jgi:hypothetical protein
MHLYCDQLSGQNKNILKAPEKTGRKFSRDTWFGLKEYLVGSRSTATIENRGLAEYIFRRNKEDINYIDNFDATKYRPAIEGTKSTKKLLEKDIEPVKKTDIKPRNKR